MCGANIFRSIFSLFIFCRLCPPQARCHSKYVCSTFIVLYSRYDLINIVGAPKTLYFCEQNNRGRIQFRSKEEKRLDFAKTRIIRTIGSISLIARSSRRKIFFQQTGKTKVHVNEDLWRVACPSRIAATLIFSVDFPDLSFFRLIDNENIFRSDAEFPGRFLYFVVDFVSYNCCIIMFIWS